MVSLLQKKVFRDIRENVFAFIAIICICTLGIALFAGMNLYVSTVENELNNYYTSANLADYWIYKAEIADTEFAEVQNLDCINQAERRKMTEVSLPGTGDAILRIHGISEQASINAPELLLGEPLSENGNNELLLDSRFAEANGITPGDYISFVLDNRREDWLVKGIIRSSEYVHYAPSGLTIPNYQKFGFAYVNASDLPQIAYNEIILTANKNMDVQIATKIRETLSGASIISRQHQTSYRTVSDDLSGNRKLGLIFPIAFFLTAALITWITVGRMMENQRQHFGILRSLGFSKHKIIRRYTFYGIIITIPSMILGWITARFLIAETLYGIGTTYYTIEVNGVDSFSPHFFIAVVCVALVTCGAAFLSCEKALKHTPAALMRPKPPAQGHRILLEKIPLFWKNLSFSGKIVTRNLFRNKGRMLMGLVGITGSAALIMCGFGITNSIDTLIDKTFTDIIHYDAEVKLKNSLTISEATEICNSVENAETYDMAMSFSVTAYGKTGDTETPYMVILEDTQNFLHFQDVNGKTVSLTDNGALITPRMSEALQLTIGDTMRVENTDGMVFTIMINNIVDFPLGNEIYMSKTAFGKISEIPFAVRALFFRGQNLELSALRDNPQIALVETKEEVASNMGIVLKLLQSIQVMLVIFSGLLAFAVMMVLGRMNYFERIRELATLKVLGFRKNEMKRLVLRENIWITIWGLPLGIITASFLLDIVLSFAKTSDMEIASHISIINIIAGCTLILCFTLFVNFLMSKNFKKIDMVSSLKSVV